MTSQPGSCPMSRGEVIEAYFLEHRAKLIDVAAFLDRVDRAGEDGGEDFRMTTLNDALKTLTDQQGDYAKRLLDLFSDPTTGLIESAGTKGASGAYPGEA